MFIVLKLHRESLRQMMKQGRVSHSIKIKVLKMLRPHVCDDKAYHGDIKELLVFNNLESYCDLKSQRNSRIIFWLITSSKGVRFRSSSAFWPIGGRFYIMAELQCTPGREHTKDSTKIFSHSDDWHWNCFLSRKENGQSLKFWKLQNLGRVVHNRKNGSGSRFSHKRIPDNYWL